MICPYDRDRTIDSAVPIHTLACRTHSQKPGLRRGARLGEQDYGRITRKFRRSKFERALEMSYPGFPFSRWTTNLVESCKALDRRGFGRDRGSAEVGEAQNRPFQLSFNSWLMGEAVRSIRRVGTEESKWKFRLISTK